MTYRALLRSTLAVATIFLAGLVPAFGDSSHARIIRLSLLQGDVRFAREIHGDPLSDQNTWERAELNLPIRQGYVLATDSGRAAVEFEDGAQVFLNEHSVLEFYDLSLNDGAKTTRLILRQGSAFAHVSSSRDDYFSLTGGDFTAEVTGRASFRVDNFDDGSSINVLKGHVSVLRNGKNSIVAKDQSLIMKANDDSSIAIGQASGEDEFDRWAESRVDAVTAATNSAQSYVNSPYYSSGVADLYTYGAWYPVAGYGNCWRPYGVGLGWSPFAGGGWYNDPFFGTSFIGNQPWGWLPYHFGGWIFDPAFGWLWTPSGFGSGYGYIPWRPVTGVWVRSKPGVLGIVPAHPLDGRGKLPVNMARGILPVNGSGAILTANENEKWKVVKAPPRGSVPANTLQAVAAPSRIARVMTARTSNPAAHTAVGGANSSLAYDAKEHRFVNSNNAPAVNVVVPPASTRGGERAASRAPGVAPASAARTAPVAPASNRAVRTMTPPPAPHASGGTRYAPMPSSVGSASSRAASATTSRSASAPASTARSAPSGGGGRPH